MKKIYTSPATDVYTVSLRSIINMSPGQTGSSTDDPDGNGIWSNDDPEASGDGGDYSRDNNRGSVWDNIW